ncbi:c-type cytochrome [Luteimonas aquatica]|uniref:c-type cytochrome n=1 Tax=Luteimonas aquatica TaxID=450364 RepID=UPI001F580382|nr:c-type cytochrome [Luteimonas aquatica]
MRRAWTWSLLAAVCAASALAFARPQDAPPADAPAAAPPAQETAAAPPAPPTPPTPYSDLRRARPIAGDAAAGQAKSELCAACHGPQGTAIAPNFPNLAGQRIDFLYWQLVEFKRGTLTESPMTPLVAELSDTDLRNLAAYYAGLKPQAPVAEATPPADAAQLQRGERLYLEGDPAKGIPPCQGCHGADARGHADALRPDRDGHVPFAAYPALRGQQSLYLQTKLGEYRDGKLHDATTDLVMRGVAERLDEDSIQALSAWLSSLPPDR